MASVPPSDNHLVLAGCVTTPCQTRYSPAGLPITRFTLEHRSVQTEAAIPREVRCRIQVLAGGTTLAKIAARLAPGNVVRVRGFVSRANHRQGEARLVLHAEHIEVLATTVTE